MRTRLDAARQIAWSNAPRTSTFDASQLLNQCRRGLSAIQVLRGWGRPWLDEQDEGTRREVDDAEETFKAYRLDALANGAHVLPVDLPDDPDDAPD